MLRHQVGKDRTGKPAPARCRTVAGTPIGQGLRPAGRVRESNSLYPDNPIAAARLMAQIVDRPGKGRRGVAFQRLINSQIDNPRPTARTTENRLHDLPWRHQELNLAFPCIRR